MNDPAPRDKPVEAAWRPLTGLPDDAHTWTVGDYQSLVDTWHALQKRLTDSALDKTLLDLWLAERRRAFAIETGQIEGLYTLKRGVTEQLITEGLDGVTAAHTLEGIDDKTIKGLLKDQETALEMVFDDIKDDKPLTHYTLRSWHQLLTRHQRTVAGFRVIDGRRQRVELPFERKGQYKLRSNNPHRQDGIVHEYCPPGQVQAEMERLLGLYAAIRKQDVPTHVEAGWLHHRFVRTHPFQDGNGRVSRLLVAYVYLRRGETPPIVTAEGRLAYIDALEEADRGELRAFCNHLGRLAALQLESLITTTKNVLAGRRRRTHANGGVTNKGVYYPPDKQESSNEYER